jgi:hypothetical protein
MDEIIIQFLQYGVLGLFLIIFTWAIIYLYNRVKTLGEEKEDVIKEILDKKSKEIKELIFNKDSEIKELNLKIESLLKNATEREKEISKDRADDMEKLINIINLNTNVIQNFDHAIREFYRKTR